MRNAIPFVGLSILLAAFLVDCFLSSENNRGSEDLDLRQDSLKDHIPLV